MPKQDLVDLTDDELANAAGNVQPGSINYPKYKAEFQRRQLTISREVADAQISAAWWTRASAIAVAASVVLTAIGIWFGLWSQ